MQWTTISHTMTAVSAGSEAQYVIQRDTLYEHTLLFSNPLGNETTYTMDLVASGATGQCYTVGSASMDCIESFDAPPTSPSTITTYYVVFSITDNANTAPLVATFTGPRGPLNVTGYSPANSYPLDPGGLTLTTFQYFETDQPGNYSAHILTTKCDFRCSTTNATGYVMTGQSSLTYDRPYYNAGLATVIVALVGIALTIVFLAINTFLSLMRRRKRSDEGGAFSSGPELST